MTLQTNKNESFLLIITSPVLSLEKMWREMLPVSYLYQVTLE